MSKITPQRRVRIRRIAALRAQGLSSPQIGKRLGIAPSTVRDYENDPYRQKARRRQLSYAVEPALRLNGGEVTAIHATAKFTPHKGRGKTHNATRRRQAQALIGWGARR